MIFNGDFLSSVIVSANIPSNRWFCPNIQTRSPFFTLPSSSSSSSSSQNNQNSKTKKTLNEKILNEQEGKAPKTKWSGVKSIFPLVRQEENDTAPYIYSGEKVTERKSVFMAHAARVTSLQEVESVMLELLKNSKIANATHNIMAYRICPNGFTNVIQDCDDDGETAAGSRLLQMLEASDTKNVIVVVTRWFGGQLLGPSRFKFINNTARDLLVSKNFINNKKETK